MPSVKCFGACGGDPNWRHPTQHLACLLCQGTGIYTTPPSYYERCMDALARVRLSHSAIVGGDEDAAAVAGKPPRKRWRERRPRRPRKTKVQRAQEKRSEEARRLEAQRREFFATKAPDPKALDELKEEWRRNHGNRR